jgi:hypothetical protein
VDLKAIEYKNVYWNQNLRIELNRGIFQPSDSMTAQKVCDQVSKSMCVKRDYALWIEWLNVNVYTYEHIHLLYVSVYIYKNVY